MNNELTKLVKKMQSNGLSIYVTNWDDNEKPYFHFSDGLNIGYCQYDSLYGIRFSTCHIPNKWCGTGFCLGYQSDYREAFKIPLWGREYNPRPYKNINHFIESDHFRKKRMVKLGIIQ